MMSKFIALRRALRNDATQRLYTVEEIRAALVQWAQTRPGNR